MCPGPTTSMQKKKKKALQLRRVGEEESFPTEELTNWLSSALKTYVCMCVCVALYRLSRLHLGIYMYIDIHIHMQQQLMK